MPLEETNKFRFIPRLNAENIFEWVLFYLLFIYLVFRAIYVPPLHDEVATFFHFIEYGDIWSDTAVLDANNHLLNSYLSRFFYLIFGEHFFYLRLPNLFAFFIYFWSIVQLLKGLNHRLNYLIALVALNTIPFVFEYFALTRGYGLGLAFFTLSIALLFNWIKTQKSVVLLFSLIAGWLSVFANLVFINSFALLIFIVIVFMIVHRANYTLKKYVFQIGSLLLVGVVIYPLIQFGLKLKNSGSLYYGGLDGFWEVTGRSLSKLVFFSDSPILKWFIIGSLLVIATETLTQLLEKKWWEFLHKHSTIIVVFLLGNIVITWGISEVMGVNYPEDRAGIYFVILYIISAIYMLDKIKWKYSGIPLLFFPMTFLYSMNLSSTSVTPDQILSPEFYEEIREYADDSSSIQMYTTQHLAWAYYERAKKDKFFVMNEKHPNAINDLIVTRKPFYNPEIHADLLPVRKDSLTKNYILIQEEPLIRKKIAQKEVTIPWNSNEFSELITFEPDRAGNYLFSLRSTIEIDSIYNDLNVVFSGNDETGEQVYYTYFPLRWYFGARNLNFEFKINHAVSLLEKKIKSLNLYLWNPQHRSFSLGVSKMTVYKCD